MAAMSGAWLRKKVRHSWLGGPRRLTTYLATLDCAPCEPSSDWHACARAPRGGSCEVAPQAGAVGVDRYSVTGEFLRCRLCQSADGELCHRIDAKHGGAIVPRNGGRADDPGTTAPAGRTSILRSPPVMSLTFFA